MAQVKRTASSLGKRIVIFLVIAALIVIAYRIGFHSGQAGQKRGISKFAAVALPAISGLFPGLILLRIAYYVKAERNAKGENDWFLRWLWLFWLVAIADWLLDQIPGAASVNRWFEYALIWFIAWVGATVLHQGVSFLIGGLAGSGIQATRQAYSLATDYGSGGLGAPVRSHVENLFAYLLSKLLI